MKLKSPSELAMSSSNSLGAAGPVSSERNDIQNGDNSHNININLVRPSLSSSNPEQELQLSSRELPPPPIIPINITPATPYGTTPTPTPLSTPNASASPSALTSTPNGTTPTPNAIVNGAEKEKDKQETGDKRLRPAASHAQAHDRGDASKSKKMQQILKSRVHKRGVRISMTSKKIGNGVVRNSSTFEEGVLVDFDKPAGGIRIAPERPCMHPGMYDLRLFSTAVGKCCLLSLQSGKMCSP